MALIGADGMLARAVRRLAPAGVDIAGFDLPGFDLRRRESVFSLRELAPDVIVNCAAYTDVDGCERERKLAQAVNGRGPALLAELAREIDATLVHISTDYVFPGTGSTPLSETDPVAPQSVYGETKLAGEKGILASGLEKYFIVRTSWLYGPGGKNFVETILRLAKEREELAIVADQVGSPTYTRDLARAIFNLLALTRPASPVTRHPSRVTAPSSSVTRHASPVTAPYGLYHFSNAGQCSWYEFAREIVAQARRAGEKLKVREIRPIRSEEYPRPAPRPAYSVLSKEKYRQVTGAEVPDWRQSLQAYFHERTST